MVSKEVEELLCKIFSGYESEENIKKDPDKYLLALLKISIPQAQSVASGIILRTKLEAERAAQEVTRHKKISQHVKSFKWMKDGFDGHGL